MYTNQIKRAIILAAGTGSRLKPLTNDMPKCLTEVNGKSILINELENLDFCEFDEAVIVIGHLANRVKESVGEKFGNLKLKYIENEIYAKTNNIYSLWLAREVLADGAVLIEGDSFFEKKVLQRLLRLKNDSSHWAVDRFTPDMNGCMLTADKSGRIIDIRIVREKLSQYKPSYFKSAGILKIDPTYGKLFSNWLDPEIASSNLGIYYDLVLAKHVSEQPIYICDISGLKWAEIDDIADLQRAEEVFKCSYEA